MDVLLGLRVLLWPLRVTSMLDGMLSNGYSKEVVLLVEVWGIRVENDIEDALQ
jgi:hypothetical protein